MEKLEKELDEALERGDTQGAKDIISSAKASHGYGEVYDYFDKAFQLAAERGNIEILKFLESWVLEDFNDVLDDDSLWNEIHWRISPAFEVACKNGHGEISRYIMDKYEHWLLDEDKPLLQMFQCGEHEYVDKYFKRCADPKGVICYTIRDACENGYLIAVNYFVYTYQLTIKEYEGSLTVAALHGHLPIVKYLIGKGADKKQRHDITSESIAGQIEISLKNAKTQTEKQKIKKVHDYLLEFHPEMFI